MLLEKAPAKINLSLDVLYKRDDGFHEIEMVMTTIDLSDHIELTPLKENVIKIISENRYVPNDSRNLAFQAAAKFKERFQIKKGVAIKINKQVPVAAGLAGGSSDAAAVLRGLNKMWQLQKPFEQLASIGAEIGSDVPFCIYGGTALAKGRGERLTELTPPPSCWVVLAKPSIGVSTKTVYEQLNLQHVQHPNTEEMVQSLKHEDYDRMCNHMGNVLESVTCKLHPEILQLKEHMRRAGADSVLMSGSGPTVFGLTRQETRAERIYNSLRGFCQEVYVVRMLGKPLELA
ncbi:4-(cytidine 5'-diphospho)-2-C-methyl-D-erythritol kinase [Salirhabdus salicampi]|uniref:4-(cytidine 5'-diphospho)-2-C-methyl-D-erythritol kinase n=1 Tax=Salirhabdus salicampi TaxID=476102 RepID=UPI0020C3EBA5|nr:4-(cytidine 5'-diphospho)-2-C-methyl-D-erythritol kinase [Salirhabdus salicampi]MCP8618168.1 4-(cytidine 5'-diphospho)-2-C-methyl-D-erythritol kinase [Salirhabdus salicampi]